MPFWQKIIVRFLRVVLPLGLLVLVSYAVYADIDVDGVRVIRHTAEKLHLRVVGPYPETRIAGVFKNAGDKYWEVAIDPVYFDVRLPRKYDTVEVELVYSADQVPLVQMGGLVNPKGWQFSWQGVQNKLLDGISWPCLVERDKGWFLCQKKKKYQSIDAFLSRPPSQGRILNFNFPLPDIFARAQTVAYHIGQDMDDFEYFIAQYVPPSKQGRWMVKRLSFPTSELYRQGDKLQFALSAPGIDQRSQTIRIKEIRFTLYKEPITRENALVKWRKFLKRTEKRLLN